jgi:hypothetical protein
MTVAAGSSRVEPGFSEAADESGISRRNGGIHFAAGDDVARASGRQVAAQAWEKALIYFSGPARS